MASRINPAGAFVRVYFDLPTDVAIKAGEVCARENTTRKEFLAQAVVEKIERSEKPRTRAKRK